MAVLAIATISIGVVLACSGSWLFQPLKTPIGTRARYVVGFMVLFFYALFWLIPLSGMGAVYKLHMERHVVPVWDRLEAIRCLRKFAERYIYENPRYADYFLTCLACIGSTVASFLILLRWQLTQGSLPIWLVMLYNCCWVGFGGRVMGGVYVMAHREGHQPNMYRPWIRKYVGNIFENYVGMLYGVVPYSFSTVHMSLHHRLDGGLGDTLYCWDLERCSWPDHLVYISRGVLHLTGFGGLWQFATSTRKCDRRNLARLLLGVTIYWLALPIALVRLSGSLWFYFWVVLSPLIAMSFFVGLMNWGFHCFIENDAQGNLIPCVNSITLLGGVDDYFGENDHMAHHYAGHVFYKDLPKHQEGLRQEWAKHKASVFQGYDAVTFTALVLMKAWPLLAARYVDYSRSLSSEEICKMLEKRTRRKEQDHSCLLPGFRAYKANSHPLVCDGETPAPAGARPDWLQAKLEKLQLIVAAAMEQQLPPIKPLAELIDSPRAGELNPQLLGG